MLFEKVLTLGANHAVHLKKTLYVLVAYPDLLLLLLLYFHYMVHYRVYLRLVGVGVSMPHVPPVPPCPRIDFLHPLLVLGIMAVELIGGACGGGGRARQGVPALLLGRRQVLRDVMGLDLQGDELRLATHWVNLLLSQRGDKRLGRRTDLPILTHNQRGAPPVLQRERMRDQLGQVNVIHGLLWKHKWHLLLLHLFRDYN